MNPDVAAYLRCPVCRAELAPAGTSLRCPRGHTFDIARQGYVNLTVGSSPHPGDTAQMIEDRFAFLAAGHYEPIMAELVRAALAVDDGLVVDAGTGTGQYLAAVLDALPGATGLGLDVSKPALRRAARIHPQAGAALTDLWSPLPLADASAAVILDVFAPRNPAEFRRILRPGGALLVVTPAPGHLAELVTALGLLSVDPGKSDRVADGLGEHFTLTATTPWRRALRLTHAEVRTLVGMGPSAWHTDPDALGAAITALPAQPTVTADVEISVWS
jgi:23S rRNA (guanine745-N1)-methyltransferase